ncbi:hypothetical protein ACFLZM_05020 [Thermodesulfobacteriota bacterium]
MAERSYDIIMPLLKDWSREVVPRQWGMKSHGVPLMFGLSRMLRNSRVKIKEHAMGFKAGAQLMNAEFKQVFPGVIYPTINHFSAWWFVPHVKIYNALGEEYIENYLPDSITLDMVYGQRGRHRWPASP